MVVTRPSLRVVHGPMRDGVSGVFVVSVGQGGLRRLAAHLTVISVWKTVVSKTVLEVGSGQKSRLQRRAKTCSPKAVAALYV